MRSQKCTQCGTLLDVSKLEKGSKFACANCGTILVVGDVAVKKTLSGPAYQPKAMRPAEAEAPARTRRRAAEGAGEPRRAPSRTPLVLGLGGVLVVIVAVAIVMAGRGGGPEGGGTGTGARATPVSWWDAVSPEVPSASASQLRSYLADARSRGYDKDPAFWGAKADTLYRALLAKDPEDADANAYFGRKVLNEYPGFQELWNVMEDHLKILPEEYRGFLARHEEAMFNRRRIWLDGEAYARETAVLKAFDAWRQQQEQDPSAELIERGKMRAQTELKDVDAAAAARYPFVLFLGFSTADQADPGARRDALAKDTKRYMPALALVAEEFDTRYRKPLNLPEIERDKALYVWIFDTIGAYREYIRERIGFGPGSDVNAYFSSKGMWVFAGLSDDPNVARYLPNDVALTAVHQLQWFHSKEKWENYFDEWNGLWFTLGLACYLGGGIEIDPSSGNATFTGVDVRRVDHLRAMQDNGIPFVPLRELVQIESHDFFNRWVGDTWFPILRSSEDLPETVMQAIGAIEGFPTKMLYAQSWYLAYFLNEYEGGKYRDKYRDLVHTALRGKRKPQQYGGSGPGDRWRSSFDAFAAIMGLSSDEDWARLQKEHDGFLSQAMRQRR